MEVRDRRVSEASAAELLEAAIAAMSLSEGRWTVTLTTEAGTVRSAVMVMAEAKPLGTSLGRQALDTMRPVRTAA